MATSPTAPLAAAIIALTARLALIVWYPVNYHFDGYQRWAGREHLLVQDWLPAAQALVAFVQLVGGTIPVMKVAFAVVAACSIGVGTLVAQRIGGSSAGWFFLPLGLFGPYLTWSIVPYQEGLYLLGVFGAIALARTRWLLAADLVAGAVALVRYEGWPFVLLYILWRRDPRAALALWGLALWVSLRSFIGVTGYAASPVHFDDWTGITQRFTLESAHRTLERFGNHVENSGTWVILVLGLIGLVVAHRRRIPGTGLLAALVLTQLAALAGWMAGLETAIYRMQVIVTLLLGPFAATALSALWEHRGHKVRAAIVLATLSFGAWGLRQGWHLTRNMSRVDRAEGALIPIMRACDSCRFLITPRAHLGTRDRHDGCEVIQGRTEWLEGRDFWCATWPQPEQPQVDHRAIYSNGEYTISAVSGSP